MFIAFPPFADFRYKRIFLFILHHKCQNNLSLVPVVLEQTQRKKPGYISIRPAPRCDVTAEGAPQRLADFNIFNMVDNFYVCIFNYFSTLSR